MTIADVFSGQRQYVVPVFQRNYEWGLQNWKTLWHDLLTVVEEEDSDFSHFIGPMVVISQVSPIDVPKYLVIDGQQRLMTLTILFIALRDRAVTLGLSGIAEAIESNTLFFVPIKGDRRGKVIPRIRDRDALEGILSRKKIIDPNHSVTKAYLYFYDEIEQLTPLQPNLFEYRTPNATLEALFSAITQRLRAVVISVEKGDNPSNIYESLNFKQEKLKDSALIKNYVFMKLPSLEEQEQFDSAYWRPLEERFAYAGSDQTDALTDFYYRFLISKTQYFARARLYSYFTQYVDGYLKNGLLSDLVAELAQYADYYAAIKDIGDNVEVETALKRFRALDVDTAIPLLLTIFQKHGTNNSGRAQVLRMLRLIESFVLRRTILRERTRGYGEVFAEACKHANSQQALAAYFVERGWPSNEEVKGTINEFRFYQREPKKTRLILTELERSYGHKEVVKLENAQIEHIMPQELTHSWREMLGPEAEAVHEKHLHTLGNLTLSGYNAELGNRPFDEKRRTYLESKITLNKYFKDTVQWTDREIVQRTQELAKILLDIWDRPEVSRESSKPVKRKF